MKLPSIPALFFVPNDIIAALKIKIKKKTKVAQGIING
jgi:hypothetical protein